MRCPCCGNEVREDERYCSHCGQNNENYTGSKPIEKVEIYPAGNSSGSSQSQTTYQQPAYQQQNGNQQSNTKPAKESSALGICAIIFGVLGGWLGLLLSIIGLCTYKTPEQRLKCKIGLGFVIGWAVVGFIIGLVLL